MQELLPRIKLIFEGGSCAVKAVLLTKAPLFVQKAELFKHSTFVLGMDTLVRLVDTKYYENSKDKMVTTLSILHRKNNRIIVAPRIDQNTQKELLTIQHCI